MLPEVFAGFDADDTLTVLDLGAGSPKTLTYLARFRSKVVFVDVLDTPELTAPTFDEDDDEIARFEKSVAAWQHALNLAPEVSIDVCLFWDFLNCLSPMSLEAFSAALQPHITHKTRGYGFGNLHAGVELPTQTYHIIDGEHLSIAPSDAPKPPFAHSQQKLTEHMIAFKVARATLLQEGRLELLFHAH